MVKVDTLNFLSELAANNNREWFHNNKTWYDSAKENVLDIITQLTNEICKFDTTIKPFDPKKGLFRIARDNRFRPDREPYKTNFGACINHQGKNITYSSTYYLNIEPNNCFVSAGVYMPVKEALQDVRYHIYNNFDEFEEIITSPDFIALFGGLAPDTQKLKRVPNNFDSEHPAAEYMKMKNFYTYRVIDDKLMTDETVALGYLIESFKVLMPFNRFINEAFAKEG